MFHSGQYRDSGPPLRPSRRSPPRWAMLWSTLLAVCLPWQMVTAAGAEGGAQRAEIAVLYPQTKEPFRSLINDILQGIRSEGRGTLRQFRLAGDQLPANLRAWTGAPGPRVLITLGNRATRATRGLSVPRVAGALIALNDATLAGGIVMSPAPTPLLARLRAVAPGTARLHLVAADGSADQAYLAAIEQAARRLKMTVDRVMVNADADLPGAYGRVLARAGSGDALWLLGRAGGLRERPLVPAILEQAWSREVLVLSNNVSDVSRGALLAPLPDNQALGRALVRLARRLSRGGDAGSEGDGSGDPVVEYLSDFDLAINLRSLRHLDLSPDSQPVRDAALTFPRGKR